MNLDQQGPWARILEAEAGPRKEQGGARQAGGCAVKDVQGHCPWEMSKESSLPKGSTETPTKTPKQASGKGLPGGTQHVEALCRSKDPRGFSGAF